MAIPVATGSKRHPRADGTPEIIQVQTPYSPRSPINQRASYGLAHTCVLYQIQDHLGSKLSDDRGPSCLGLNLCNVT